MKKTLICLSLFFAFFISYVHAQDKEQEEYVIEKFDTLWDISNNKLDDPFLWPKLWNVNPQIENPDLIYPGTRVYIPSREELMRMPSFPVKKIPLTKKPAAVKKGPKSTFIFAPKKRQKYIVNKTLFITSGWIADTFPAVGTVSLLPSSREIAAKGDTVYLTVNGGMLQSRYYVIRDTKMVIHPVSEKKIGHHIKIVGVIDIVGIENKRIKARVSSSYGDIVKGDGLLPYHDIEPPLIPETARTPDLDGYIVETNINSYLIGEGDIVFLDKGEKDGIEVGDMFPVHSDPPTQSPVGKILIVSIQSSTSGAVPLKSIQVVFLPSYPIFLPSHKKIDHLFNWSILNCYFYHTFNMLLLPR